MALVIAINAASCFGVIVMVVAPLVWAILTQHCDALAVVGQRRRRLRVASQAPRRAPRPQYKPVSWPA
jgi:hypothetical protein